MSVDDVIYQLESLKNNSLSFIDGGDDNIWRRDVAALNRAIHLIGFRKRKKVKEERTIIGEHRCPTCNAVFIGGMGKINYCGNCGQKLDWGE